jgi:hypothetical protein
MMMSQVATGVGNEGSPTPDRQKIYVFRLRSVVD